MKRVLLLAGDAMDPGLVTRWAEEGRLPTFQALLKDGARYRTTNPVGLYVGAIWPTFATGVSAARHRSYCFDQFDPRTYRDLRFSPDGLAATPFWAKLGAAGRRVAVIDVPLVPLTTPRDGLHIVEWGSHDPMYRQPRYGPTSAKAEVGRVAGRAPLRACDGVRRSVASYRRLRDKLLKRISLRVRLLRHFLRKGEWHLFAAVFSESHCAGHQMWHLHDASHPRHDPDLARALGDPLFEIYRAIDAGIGEVLNEFEGTVMILASHGMGPHYDATFLLDAMLRRMEDPGCRLERIGPGLIHPLWMRLPLAVRRLVSPVLRPPYKWFQARPLVASRRKRRTFAIPNNDAHAGVRINLVGREAQGVVQAGEYEQVCNEMESGLRAFTICRDGTPLVREVHRARELYNGPGLDELPDLLVEWNRGGAIDAVESKRTGRIEGVFPGTRTGDHTPEGLLILKGAGRGERGRIDLRDIAPTLFDLLEVPPEGLEGRSILAPATSARG